MSDPDPDPLGLGERRCLSDGQTEENEENNIDDSSNYDSPVDVSLDETPEISARVITLLMEDVGTLSLCFTSKNGGNIVLT